MSISAPEASIIDVGTTDDHLIVSLNDGRQLRTPLAWYPRLLAASQDERDHWELLADGEGVSWPNVDEDLSLTGMLAGVPAPGFESGLKTPAELAACQIIDAARDFFGMSLVQARTSVLETRSRLTDLLDEIPQSSTLSFRSNIGVLTDSLTSVLETIDDVAYATGTEDTMDHAETNAETKTRPEPVNEQISDQQIAQQVIADQHDAVQEAEEAATAKSYL